MGKRSKQLSSVLYFKELQKTSNETVDKERTNECWTGLKRSSLTLFLLFLKIPPPPNFYLVITMMTIGERTSTGLLQSTLQTSTVSEKAKKKKNTDRFILCYISILHIFILTCSERSLSVGLRCIFMRDGSIRAGLIARNFKFYSLQLEVSHLWHGYIVTFNIYYSLKCIAWSQAVTFAILSTVLLRSKRRSRPEINRLPSVAEMKHYALW